MGQRRNFLSLRRFKPCVWCLPSPNNGDGARRGSLDTPHRHHLTSSPATSISRRLCGQGLFVSSPLLLPLSPAAGPESAPSPPLPPARRDIGETEGNGRKKRVSGWNLRSLDPRRWTWRRERLSPTCLMHPCPSSWQANPSFTSTPPRSGPLPSWKGLACS